jgi:hypothetical protein
MYKERKGESDSRLIWDVFIDREGETGRKYLRQNFE